MRALIDAARNARPIDVPLLLVLLFAGLRASEARALPWRNVDLAKGTITVDQRADFRNVMGPPKSASGFRTIPVPQTVITELKKRKLRCPRSGLDLVFPSEAGTPIFHSNVVESFQEPVQIAAGISRMKTKRARLCATPTGSLFSRASTLHEFQHAAASLWIEQRVAPKRVQTWMGHSSIQMTFDTYDHLFAALEDDSASWPRSKLVCCARTTDPQRRGGRARQPPIGSKEGC